MAVFVIVRFWSQTQGTVLSRSCAAFDDKQTSIEPSSVIHGL